MAHEFDDGGRRSLAEQALDFRQELGAELGEDEMGLAAANFKSLYDDLIDRSEKSRQAGKELEVPGFADGSRVQFAVGVATDEQGDGRESIAVRVKIPDEKGRLAWTSVDPYDSYYIHDIAGKVFRTDTGHVEDSQPVSVEEVDGLAGVLSSATETSHAGLVFRV